MHTAVRPFATAGVSLIGATAIAMTPVLAPTVGTQIQRVEAQVEQVAVQLAAASSPEAAFSAAYQAAITNMQTILTKQLATPTPILTQVLKNQITAMQDFLKLAAKPGSLVIDATKVPGVKVPTAPTLINALGTSLHDVYTNVTTAVPPLLQSAMAELAQGQIEAANNQVLLAALTAVIPLTNVVPSLLNTISQPLQGLVSAIDNLGPLGVIVANPLQNVVNVFNTVGGAFSGLPVSNATLLIGGLLGPLITTAGAMGAGVQDIFDAAHTGNLGNVVKAVLTLPATMINGFLNGGYGPDLQSIIDSGLPGAPLNPGGLLSDFTLAFAPKMLVNLPGPIRAIQLIVQAITTALKVPPVKAAPVVTPAAAAAELPAVNAVPELTAAKIALPAASVATATASTADKKAHLDRHVKNATEAAANTADAGAKNGSDAAGDQTGTKRHGRDHGKGHQGSDSSSNTKPAASNSTGSSSNHHKGGSHGHGGHAGHGK